MKYFWITILILAAATGVLLFADGDAPSAEEPAGLAAPQSAPAPARRPAPEPRAAPSGATPAPEAEPVDEDTAPQGGTAPETAGTLGWATTSEEPPVFTEPIRKPDEPIVVETKLVERAPESASENDEPVERLARVDTDLGTLDEALGLDPAPEPDGAEYGPPRPGQRTTPAARGTRSELSSSEAESASGEKMKLNERFMLSGSGTESDPYLLAWDVLLSVQEDYRPRQGKTELPEWVSKLEGKRVRLSGFLAAPMMAEEASEILLMRNEWDGCCIGVPPTPYDSVEVKLRQASSIRQHMINFGAVEGTMRIDPYLWKDWLISLYRFEDARIADTGF